MPDSQPQQPSSRGPRPGDGRSEPASLVLCGARLTDGRTVDVRLNAGRITAVTPAGARPAPTPATRIDLHGHLLLPAPVEPHAHFDVALTAEGDGAGSGRGRAEGSSQPAGGACPLPGPAYQPGDIQRRATEAALLQLGHGATAMRSHVRVGGPHGLAGLQALLRARRSLHGLGELTTVAVAGVLTGRDGAEGRALLRDAVRMGASAVGGCPDLDPDPEGHITALLELAADCGCAVDLHLDGGAPKLLDRLATLASELGVAVTVGPCGGLSRLPYESAARVAERLAGAGVGVICLPQGGCGMAGWRGGSGAECEGGRGGGAGAECQVQVGRCCGLGPSVVAPVRLLGAAGVRLAAGSGALRDSARPVGRGDPLEAAFLLAAQHGLSPAAAYAAVSADARALLGLPEVRIAPGFPAELLAVRGTDLSAALSLAYSRIVIHRGRVVARTSAVREYCDSAVAAGFDLPRQVRVPGGGGSGGAGADGDAGGGR
ncbi:hydrolase [Streptomyces sp. NA04227]|uniref:amidohydrolase family protein n=1 Tax=Streptomyces sp. NA04227 TaxID=2742136 RepID=UPI0015913446|nr:amidohydrolase family protein [Streptomyces sp. NA04227]QKW08564.1 hydrolase [Streptomyces sp. NA04227]